MVNSDKESSVKLYDVVNTSSLNDNSVILSPIQDEDLDKNIPNFS